MGQSDLSYLRVFRVLNWPDEDEDEDVIILCWTMIVWWFCCDWGEGASCIIIYYRDLCMARMLNTLEIRWTANSPYDTRGLWCIFTLASFWGEDAIDHYTQQVELKTFLVGNGIIVGGAVRWRHHHFDFCICFCRWYKDKECWVQSKRVPMFGESHPSIHPSIDPFIHPSI